ncbi:Homeodomain-like protein [Mycena galericulata]|nr:Homeodomain-like protein [Mycena galericulata]
MSILPVPTNRERRQWTAQEDELLRLAVDREEPGNPAPSKWHAIAQHVPNRTNKDCRKRWYAKMSSDVVKGGWAPDEDQRLLNAIDCFGTRWSLVASMVQTRNSDQCAKRWCDTLNPAIDRTAWSAEADDLLVHAVREHGKVWTKIVQMYFPGRTGLAAKNRWGFLKFRSMILRLDDMSV